MWEAYILGQSHIPKKRRAWMAHSLPFLKHPQLNQMFLFLPSACLVVMLNFSSSLVHQFSLVLEALITLNIFHEKSNQSFCMRGCMQNKLTTWKCILRYILLSLSYALSVVVNFSPINRFYPRDSTQFYQDDRVTSVVQVVLNCCQNVSIQLSQSYGKFSRKHKQLIRLR